MSFRAATSGRPPNYNDDYAGRITFRRALIKSANAATVRVSQAVGIPRVIEAARTQRHRQPAAQRSVDRARRARGDAAGARHRVRAVRQRRIPREAAARARIETADGTSSGARTTPASGPRVMDPRDAYQLTSMLQAVVDYGTGRVVRDYGREGTVAGKTGTTNNGADVWFVGYTPTLVAGFWFGYDTPRQSRRRVGRPSRRAGVGRVLSSTAGASTRRPTAGIRRPECRCA